MKNGVDTGVCTFFGWSIISLMYSGYLVFAGFYCFLGTYLSIEYGLNGSGLWTVGEDFDVFDYTDTIYTSSSSSKSKGFLKAGSTSQNVYFLFCS